MLTLLKNNANLTYTENGALTNSTSGSYCLDLFFRAGGMRTASEKEISDIVIRAYCEDPVKTMKILFFTRDIRGGLGERRFFRTAVKTLADFAPEAVQRNAHLFAEYGRFDDLCALLGTQCEECAVDIIKKQLQADIKGVNKGGEVSLLVKWLPSVNASSLKTKNTGKMLAKKLGMTERAYRKTLSSLRRYIDIIENRLRKSDYSFDYEKQCSGALLKYRKAFIRNDYEHYTGYLNDVSCGKASYNSSTLFPYDIVRKALKNPTSKEERTALDTAWKNLPEYGNNNDNAIAVVDGSGSMYWGGYGGVEPAEAALSLGIYFAEHNTGAFHNHFITFSEHPQLVEIKGKDIVSKVNFCETFNEVANTNLEAVFKLILKTAVENKLKNSELPSKLYIISDMEFDCVRGGDNKTLYLSMKERYESFGYTLPDVIFWNVASHQSNIPVTLSESGAALVSGFSPALFDMVIGGDINPEKILDKVINSERYAMVS